MEAKDGIRERLVSKHEGKTPPHTKAASVLWSIRTRQRDGSNLAPICNTRDWYCLGPFLETRILMRLHLLEWRWGKRGGGAKRLLFNSEGNAR